ncbi:hypothetical protein ACHGLA_33710 [Streptomyces sp. YH02]|uniref:hypothetical protein n=1 Tax=Streptomyces sp. YH02 TaxID=3256999 RepID=UPI0037580306
MRLLAEQFLATHFTSPTADPTQLGKPLGGLEDALDKLAAVNTQTVRQLVQTTFGAPVAQVVSGAAFKGDLELLQNAVVAVKLVTGYGSVDAATVVRQLRAAAFLSHLAALISASSAAGPGAPAATSADKLDRAEVRRLLARPLRIPPGPLAAVAQPPGASRVQRTPDEGPAEERARTETLREERDRLQAAYDKLLTARPEELELVTPEAPPEDTTTYGAESSADESVGASGPSSLRLAEAAWTSFDDAEHAAPAGLRIEAHRTAVPEALDRIGRRLLALNEELLPLEKPTTAKVYRTGGTGRPRPSARRRTRALARHAGRGRLAAAARRRGDLGGAGPRHRLGLRDRNRRHGPRGLGGGRCLAPDRGGARTRGRNGRPGGRDLPDPRPDRGRHRHGGGAAALDLVVLAWSLASRFHEVGCPLGDQDTHIPGEAAYLVLPACPR